MKKKIIIVVSVLVMVCTLFVGASAVSIKLNQQVMTVDGVTGDFQEDEYFIITQDNISDEVVEALGSQKDILENYLETNEIIFDVLKKDISFEITITVSDKTVSMAAIDDYNTFSDEDLMLMANVLVGQEQNGILYENADVAKTDDVTYMVFDIDYSGMEGIQYSTIHKEKVINILGISYDGTLTNNDIQDIKTLVNSLSYNFAGNTNPVVDTKTEPVVDTKTEIEPVVDTKTEDNTVVDTKSVSLEAEEEGSDANTIMYIIIIVLLVVVLVGVVLIIATRKKDNNNNNNNNFYN